MIPADPKWCSHCVKPEYYGRKKGEPCSNHTGPNGKHAEYRGHDVYVPSEFVLSVVGKTFNCWSGNLMLCFGYDWRHGFWMRDLKTGEERNVSERAIGRTYHEVYGGL